MQCSLVIMPKWFLIGVFKQLYINKVCLLLVVSWRSNLSKLCGCCS